VGGNWTACENSGIKLGKGSRSEGAELTQCTRCLSAQETRWLEPNSGGAMNTGKEKPAIVVEPAEDPIRTSEPVTAPEPEKTPAKEPTPA
jgi:hypothetical protein